jgi:hypothetical protein
MNKEVEQRTRSMRVHEDPRGSIGAGPPSGRRSRFARLPIFRMCYFYVGNAPWRWRARPQAAGCRHDAFFCRFRTWPALFTWDFWGSRDDVFCSGDFKSLLRPQGTSILYGKLRGQGPVFLLALVQPRHKTGPCPHSFPHEMDGSLTPPGPAN